MLTKQRATIEDLYKVDGKAEIVNGEIVHLMPSGEEPSIAAGEIFASLRAYARKNGWGRAVPDGTGFVVNLPNRESFSPDAAFYDKPRSGMRFVDGAPLFAVEVRSENDYGPGAERQIANKRADYFAADTEVVWDVDLLSQDVIRKYVADDPDKPMVFRRGETADAEPALPGWRMQVDDLFE
jgi:Uma2 family endonuclease